MNFLRKLFNQRQSSSSSNELKVVVITQKLITEEQKNAIISITKRDSMLGVDPIKIANDIMQSTGVEDVAVLNRELNCVEVIF